MWAGCRLGSRRTQFWLPRYLGDRFGLSLEEAGWQATAWVQAATVVGLFLGGKLGDWKQMPTVIYG